MHFPHVQSTFFSSVIIRRTHISLFLIYIYIHLTLTIPLTIMYLILLVLYFCYMSISTMLPYGKHLLLSMS